MDKNLIVLVVGFLLFFGLVFGGLSYEKYLNSQTDIAMAKAGLVQKRDGIYSAPIWVKSENK